MDDYKIEYDGTTVDPVGAILDERGKEYGDFKEIAEASQRLKRTIKDLNQMHSLPPFALEALDNICSKMVRFVCSNGTHVDSILDIEGYARLIRENMK